MVEVEAYSEESSKAKTRVTVKRDQIHVQQLHHRHHHRRHLHHHHRHHLLHQNHAAVQMVVQRADVVAKMADTEIGMEDGMEDIHMEEGTDILDILDTRGTNRFSRDLFLIYFMFNYLFIWKNFLHLFRQINFRLNCKQ